MAQANLNDVIKQLQQNRAENSKENHDIMKATASMAERMDAFVDFLQKSRREGLEKEREKQYSAATRSAGSGGKPGKSDDFLGLTGLIAGLGMGMTTLASALTALTAEALGLDAAIKAATLPSLFKNISGSVKSLTTFFTDSQKGLTRLVSSLPKIDDIFPKIIIPEKLKMTFIDIDTRLRLPIIEFLDETKANIKAQYVSVYTRIVEPIEDLYKGIMTRIQNFKIDPKITVLDPVNNFFQKVSDLIPKAPEITLPKILTAPTEFFKTFFSGLGKFYDDYVPKFETPEWAKSIQLPTLDGIKEFFTGTDGNGGIVKFFQKIADFTAPLLKPLIAVGRIAFGPIAQIVISLIDFFDGFYKAFTRNEFDEFGNKITLLDKVLKGLEGGVLGVIKGITEAIDLIFIGIPAWILEKLGFEETAAELNKFWEKGGITQFVEPIWNWFKNLPEMIMGLFPSAEAIKNQLKDLARSTAVGRQLLKLIEGDPEAEKEARIKSLKGKISTNLEDVSNLQTQIAGLEKRLAQKEEREFKSVTEEQADKLRAREMKAIDEIKNKLAEAQADLRASQIEMMRAGGSSVAIGGSTTNSSSSYSIFSDPFKELAMDADAPGII